MSKQNQHTKYEQAESAYQKQVKSDFSEALAEENLEWLDGLIDGLVKSYEKVPKIPTLEDESFYQSNLINKPDIPSKTMPKLKNQTLCQSPEEKRKQSGVESLNIFNLKNSKGQTAVMLAAKHGRNDLLEKWYNIPDQLTDDISNKEGREGVYEQRISSYIAQDNEGCNALMLAIKFGHSECFPLLLSPETAITLNQKDKAGKTALMYAIESKNVNLIKKFISVIQEVLGRVNQYDPGYEVKLEICSDTSRCIQNNEGIEPLIIKFISESSEHISMPCKIPLSLLKRKNTESIPVTQESPREVETIIIKLPPKQYHKNTKNQGNGTPEKKRKENSEIVDKTTQKALHVITEFDYKTKSFTGPFSKKLDRFKEYINFMQLASDSCTKEKHQELGQFLLEKLLHEADSPYLTDNQKKEIINCVKNLVIKARIKFPEDFVQAIQMPDEDMRSKIFDIITQDTKEKNGPNSHLHNTIASMAGPSTQR